MMLTLIENRRIGDYLVKEELGHTGVAVIHRAVDERTGQEVALKILLSQHVNKSGYSQRIVSEAQKISQLLHSNLVRVYEVGEANGLFFLVLEYNRGDTLSEFLADSVASISTREALRILRPVAEGLEYVHDKGFVHRGVNLDNIKLIDQSRVLLSECGLTERLDSGDTTTLSALADYPKSAYAFLSPEQVCADVRIDQRSDIYSFGVVAYRLLTGCLPFQAESETALLHKIVHEPPPDPARFNPLLSPGVGYVLARVLAKDPPMRYRSAVAFVNALDEGQSWVPRANGRSPVSDTSENDLSHESGESHGARSADALAVADKRTVGVSRWSNWYLALAASMLLAVITLLFIAMRSSLELPFAVQETPAVVQQQPAESQSKYFTALILEPFVSPDGAYVINVPVGWQRTVSNRAVVFDALDFAARVLIHPVVADDSTESVTGDLDRFIRSGNLVLNFLKPVSKTHVQIGKNSGYEHQFEAKWRGEEVFVRLVIINAEEQTYIIGTVVEFGRKDTLDDSFDAIFSSFRLTRA